MESTTLRLLLRSAQRPVVWAKQRSAMNSRRRSLSAQQSKAVPERAAAVAEFIEAPKGRAKGITL
jgi:hypothetical protein